MSRAQRLSYTLLVAACVATASGCATASPQYTADTKWVLIQNPRAGLANEPPYVWVPEDRLPAFLRDKVASAEVVARYGTPPSGGKVSALHATQERWVLIENPRFGTINAQPSDRRYVWVLEDRTGGLPIVDAAIAREQLPAPGPVSAKQGLTAERSPDPPLEAVEDKHDAVLSVSSSAPADRLRADSIACDETARSKYVVSVRYVEQLRLAGMPWESSLKDRLLTDPRIVPYWAQAADGVLMLGTAALSVLSGVAITPATPFSHGAKKFVVPETKRPLESYKTCMNARGHVVELSDRETAHAAASENGILGWIRARCAKAWSADLAKQRDCEDEQLASFRLGIIPR